MKLLRPALLLTLLLNLSTFAAEPPPAKALKYHEALLKRPANDTLFDRFFSSWIDEQDIASLEEFLESRATENGGADLSVLARYQLRRGNEDEALETLGKAITANPEDFTLSMERSKVLLRRLDFENARKDLKKVSTGADGILALEASKLIGRSWLREGNPEQAIKVWDAILAANPGDEDLLEDLVESAATEGETEQALVYVDKLIAASTDPYKKTLRQLRRGDLLAQANRTDDAIDAYSKTLGEVGEGSWLEREVLAQIDSTYRKQDRLNELKDKLVELAEANPRRLLIHRQLAQIEIAQGETDSAVGRFREVLKRSPGNRELREEFVRLLTDGEKYVEAAEELGKLIELAPEDAGLHLQLADLRNREENKEATLAALEKARTLLGADETSGIRIASLMFQYDLGEAGEKILTELASAENASPAPSEALAAEYARTNRKPEALALLEKIGTADNMETVLRAAASISALSESETALKILSAKTDDFGTEPRFLAAISQAALAAEKPDVAVTHAIKLVRVANPNSDLAESIGIALRAIVAADKSMEWRATLEKQDTRTPAETCLLAALADSHSDFEAVAKIMENATDPVVIRFHAAILDRRGEFGKAIEVLASLADTDEGRKTSYFKDMTDLQRRAGLVEDALATVELWKQSAPGDKNAWVTEGSILREQGRPEEAVKSARKAVARFGEDTDLAATLASLHEEAGQMEDAEAIYWQLYDESESPSDQARWAVQLAELARRTGRIDDLDEKLRERARNNRRSIGPILAQAELARITNNEEKRRDLLLEAVRLQPKNIDLRLQISNLEEQSGNPDRVIAILEEAIPFDSSNRVRSALAQAYLRQGQTMKGMRELRALAGKNADDPRSVESSVASLAQTGLYEEAIRFLRETLPDGGDWRTKYLLAIMLEQDGRESEAIPLFQSLLQATGELAGISKPPNPNQRYFDRYAPEVQEVFRLMGAAQSAYSHRNANNNRGSYFGNRLGATVGPFVLPDDAETVRTFSRIHLAKLNAGAIENGDFIKELISSPNQGQPNFPAMLSKYPDQPGLLEICLLFAAGNRNANQSIDTELLKKLLSERKNISAIDRFRANLILATRPGAEDSAWQEIAPSASKILEADNKGSEDLIYLAFSLLQMLADKSFDVPEKHRETLSEILLEIASSDKLEDGRFEGFKLIAAKAVGTTEQWIQAANEEVVKFRKSDSKAPSAYNPYNSYSMGRNPLMGNGAPFSLPDLNRIYLTSIPPALFRMITPPGGQNRYYGYGADPVEPKSLLETLDSFESPVLRAYIAMCAEDETAAEKQLSATPPEIEAADFSALRALRAVSRKEYASAYKLLSELRPAYSSDRNRLSSLNADLLAIAAEMTAEERAEISGELRAMLIQLARVAGTQSGPILAAQAGRLGFPKLAQRFLPSTVTRTPGGGQLGAATFGKRPTSSSSGGNHTIEKMKQFAAAGKNEAAALEALNLIRAANTQSYNRSYQIRQVKEAITPEVTKELLKLTDPGDSKSLTKLTEHADICLEFGKPDEALAILTRLHAERPDDGRIAGKLAFLLPDDQREKTVELITKAGSENDFVETAATFAEGLSNNENNEKAFSFFSIVADWLESAPPEDLKSANLTWVSYHGKNFFTGNFTRNIPNLQNYDPENAKEKKKDSDRYADIGKRLALAMLRHDSIAEEGFRLLRHSKAWEIEPETLDAHARRALEAAARTTDGNNRYHSHFSLVMGSGSSSSGDHLDQLSSVRWITERLSETKSPDDILPPDYLSGLREKNLSLGELVSALANLSDVKDLEKLWEANALEKVANPVSQMLSQGILERAASIPGANGFFLKRISDLKPGWANQRGSRSADSNLSLLTAALKTAVGEEDDATVTKTCAAISKSIFGEKINFDEADNSMNLHNSLNVMESVISNAKLDPAGTVRIHSAFYLLDIPVGDNLYSIYQPFRELRVTKIEEAEEIFSSLGWLDEVDTWKPFAANHVESDYNGNAMRYLRKEEFLLPQVFSYMNFSMSRPDVVKYLEERKPRTFGALITAASLVSGQQRSELTAKAFAHAAPKLAKIPPEGIKVFSPLLSWLPAEEMAKLPAAFREKAEGENSRKLEKLVKDADNFLKNPLAPNRSGDQFQLAMPIVSQLAPLDLDKAVAIFLEAERRFTTDSARTGRISSYTSSGLQITERDRYFEDLLQDSDSSIRTDLELTLAFYAKIAESPESSRFSFSGNRNGIPILYEIGGRILNSPSSTKPDKNNPSWLIALRKIEKMPEALRKDARIALACYLIGNHNMSRSVKLPEDRESLSQMKDLSEEIIAIRSISIGVSRWKNDTPEGHKSTSDALVAIANDSEIALSTRFQLLSVCLTMVPELLNDPAIGEAFTSSFEQYAKQDRSVINSIGLHAPRSASMVTVTETSKPLIIRINQAFWENANVPKPGGHGPIPPEYGDELFLASSNAGDIATAKKLITLAKPVIDGNATLILSLVRNGNHELAKTVLASADHAYKQFPTEPYSRSIEKDLNAFRETPDLDPLGLLRIESQFMNMPLATGEEKPEEGEAEREQRLVKAYKADPPSSRLLRTEILAALTRDSHTAALALSDEVIALAKEIDLNRALEDWQKGTHNNSDPTPRYQLAPLESVVCRQAAFLLLLQGDASALAEIAETLKKRPTGTSHHSNGYSNYVEQYMKRINESAPLWIAEAVHLGKTKGFKDAFEPFAELSLIADNRNEFGSWDMTMPLAIAEFFAYWNNEGEKFEILRNKIKRNAKSLDYLKERWGVLQISKVGKQHLRWNRENFAEARHDFLIKVFTRPEMTGYFGHIQRWLPDTAAQCDLREDLLRIANDIPENTVPTVLPHLLNFRANDELNNNDFDAGFTNARAAVDACPDQGPWKDVRFRMRYTLVEKLIAAERTDEAREVYSQFKAEDFSENQKKRHLELGEKITAAEK